jgi:hypothetical protein
MAQKNFRRILLPLLFALAAFRDFESVLLYFKASCFMSHSWEGDVHKKPQKTVWKFKVTSSHHTGE